VTLRQKLEHLRDSLVAELEASETIDLAFLSALAECLIVLRELSEAHSRQGLD
jgi:hypothetical protein